MYSWNFPHGFWLVGRWGRKKKKKEGKKVFFLFFFFTRWAQKYCKDTELTWKVLGWKFPNCSYRSAFYACFPNFSRLYFPLKWIKLLFFFLNTTPKKWNSISVFSFVLKWRAQPCSYYIVNRTDADGSTYPFKIITFTVTLRCKLVINKNWFKHIPVQVLPIYRFSFRFSFCMPSTLLLLVGWSAGF